MARANVQGGILGIAAGVARQLHVGHRFAGQLLVEQQRQDRMVERRRRQLDLARSRRACWCSGMICLHDLQVLVEQRGSCLPRNSAGPCRATRASSASRSKASGWIQARLNQTCRSRRSRSLKAAQRFAGRVLAERPAHDTAPRSAASGRIMCSGLAMKKLSSRYRQSSSAEVAGRDAGDLRKRSVAPLPCRPGSARAGSAPG